MRLDRGQVTSKDGMNQKVEKNRVLNVSVVNPNDRAILRAHAP